MSSSHQFAIMSLHAGQKYYHKVCTIYLAHSEISSVDCGKGSRPSHRRPLSEIYYPQEDKEGGGYWGLEVFLLQYSPLVKI